jgi:O-antigen/teichoic acid export membrane protein
VSKLEPRQKDTKPPLRRIAGNFGKLLSGRSAAAVLELTTIAVLTRSLSTTDFGQLVLIQTYVLVVRGLFNFRLAETVVRFGVSALEANKERSFRRLLRAALAVEVAASGCSLVVAILALPLAAKFFDWPQDLVFATLIYSSVLLTSARGTPKGILRVFDRFDVLGAQIVVSPVLRLFGVLIAAMLDAKVLLFITVLTIATFAGNVYLIVRGWIEFRRRVGGRIVRGPSLKGWREDYPDLRSFISIVYAQTNVDKLPKEASTLLAGSLLGPAGAGMIRVAREGTKILSKPGNLLQQALFPDLVRLWSRGTIGFRSVLLRIVLITGLIGFVVITASIFGGRLLLTSLLGPDYSVAAPLMSLFLLSATLELVVNMLRAGGYAMGLAGKILWLHAISAALYLAGFVILTPYVGLIGPGIAACFSAIVFVVGISVIISRGIQAAPLGPGQSFE